MDWSAEAIERLLHYPYGCAEQTASSMLPWLTLREIKRPAIGCLPEFQERADLHPPGAFRGLPPRPHIRPPGRHDDSAL